MPLSDTTRLAGPRARTAQTPRPLSLLGLLDLHRRSFVLCVLLFVAAGLSAGYFAPVTYTAQGQMLAAGTSVDAAAVPSFTQAGQSLAQTYSRVFSGDDVQQQLRTNGLDGATETVTASPMAGTSVVVIEATAPTPQRASQIVDQGIAALGSTVGTLLDNTELVAATRARMVAAYEEQAEAQARIDVLDRRKVDQNSTAYGEAIAQLSSAQANADALRQLLTQQIGVSVAANGIAPLTSASATGSNSRQRFETWGALGLIAGVLVWLGFSLLRSRGTRRPSGLRRSSAT